MGLTLAVGLYAKNLAEDEDSAEYLDEPFVQLNEVLVENGMAPHSEPRAIPNGEYFEAEMWGYGGVHALRRLAAYISIKGELPKPMEYGAWNDDPVYLRFNQSHEQYIENSTKTGFLSSLRKKLPRPSYQHSDAEGFYVPQTFDEVIVDWSDPQRPGLGMMIGSSAKLLEECEALAKLLKLPSDFDPDSDEFLELVGSPPEFGEPWQILAVEAHTVANLTNAARASLKLGSTIQFC